MTEHKGDRFAVTIGSPPNVHLVPGIGHTEWNRKAESQQARHR